MSIEEHATVEFLEDVEQIELGVVRARVKRGDQGVVVHLHGNPPVAYMVEVMDKTGRTLAIVDVETHKVRRVCGPGF